MKYNIEYLLELEGQHLVKKLSECYSSDSLTQEIPTEKAINNAFKHVHTMLINNLIDRYMLISCRGYVSSSFSSIFEGTLLDDISLPNDFEIEYIPQLCEMLHVSYLNSLFAYARGKIYRKKSKSNLLETGAVYTQDQIAYEIVHRTLSNMSSMGNPESLKVLDFATGTGRFYRQVVKCMSEVFSIPSDYSILNNIYAVDIDPVALNVCRINAMSLLSVLDLDKAKRVSEHIILKNALMKELLFEDKMAISHDDFGGLFFNGFDAIVSNPPYLVLKPNKNKMDEQTVENINTMIKYFRSSSFYNYAIEGMLNLYQLSLEAMLGMLKTGGEMGIICPSTLFADGSASTLRKHLLAKHKVSYIKYFTEDDSLFENVTQATCIFHLTKGGNTTRIDIVQGERSYQIALGDVKQIFGANWEIPSIEKVEWDILRKLLSIPVLKNQPHIRNKRGELDLSLFKDYITSEPTSLRLVRGNMISADSIVDSNHEYVRPEFFEKKSQDYLSHDKGRRRLVCQQISNMTQRVRLRFVECESNDVLGNSCNYITVAEEKIPQMKTLLNSALLNWRFKITSTNNHINNYELDELPIIELDAVTSDVIDMDDISKNKKICSLYGLEGEEINFIIKQI
jgi:Alw26I/Eco31I/Esp3I family type II restriction m6 adenine DNA methyltransferase